jgi:ABC-type ATPase involved in cell division
VTRLELLGVSKSFPGVRAVESVDLTVPHDSVTAVLGPSGCGKTTLLRLVAGLETLTSGVIAVDGQQVVGPGSDRGMVFQHSTLYPWLTIQKNVEFGLKLQGYPKAERWERASVYLDMVGLTEFSEAYPKQLSGDMKQRAAIAKALVCEPKILLMDGPGINPWPTDTRLSKTKHSPCHRLSVSGTSSRYFSMPPLRWKTFSKPSALTNAVAFSQRMPPVQYIAIFGLLRKRSLFWRNHFGKSRKFTVSGSIAPLNAPIAVS